MQAGGTMAGPRSGGPGGKGGDTGVATAKKSEDGNFDFVRRAEDFEEDADALHGLSLGTGGSRKGAPWATCLFT